jgi:hypothetical protein
MVPAAAAGDNGDVRGNISALSPPLFSGRWPLYEGARRYIEQHSNGGGEQRENRVGGSVDGLILEFFDYTTKGYYLWDSAQGKLAKKLAWGENCCTESNLEKRARRRRERARAASSSSAHAPSTGTGGIRKTQTQTSSGSRAEATAAKKPDRCAALLLGLPMPAANAATGIPFAHYPPRYLSHHQARSSGNHYGGNTLEECIGGSREDCLAMYKDAKNEAGIPYCACVPETERQGCCQKPG